MSTRLPWNIKGIDKKTRQAASRAAEEAGVPLGEWLSGLIATADTEKPSAALSAPPLLLSDTIDPVPSAKPGSAAVEAVRHAIKTLLDRLQDSQAQGAFTLDTLEGSLRELAAELQASQSTLAASEHDQHAYLSGLSKDLFDLSTRVSLMEASRGGNAEATAIQVLEEAIGKITTFIEAADKRQTEAIKTIGSTLDTLATEVGRQGKSREADRAALLAKAQSADEKISSINDASEGHREKIVDMQSRIATVERRQSDNARLIEDKIDTRFDDLDESFTRLRDRLRGLEKRQAEDTDTPVAAIEVAIDRLSRRIDHIETVPNLALEEKLQTQAKAAEDADQRMKEGFTALTGAVEELAGRIAVIEGGASAPEAPSNKAKRPQKPAVPQEEQEAEAPKKRPPKKTAKPKPPAPLAPSFELDDIADERAFDENAGLMRYLFALILIIFLGTSLLLLVTGQVEMPGGGRPGPGSSFFDFFKSLMSDGAAAPHEPPLLVVENEPRAGYQR